MAGLISKTLLRHGHTLKGKGTTSSSSCIIQVPHRHRSSQPTKPKPQLIQIDLNDYEVAHKLFNDDLIQRVLVKQATPDWLPFLPGSSFWVPPPSSKVLCLIPKRKLNNANDLTHHLSLSLPTLRGCPTSKFFVQPQENESDHSVNAGMEVNNPEGMEVTVQVKVLTISENVALSEDEEG